MRFLLLEQTVRAVLCSKCGTDLPDGSQFCLKCGEPIRGPETKPAVETSSPSDARTHRPAPAGRRGPIIWIFLAIVLVAILWAATSGNPFAQGIQSLAGSKQDQTIVGAPFTVSAHSFRYYKLPPTEANHAVVLGRFTVSNATPSGGGDGQSASDQDIEVYVMSDSAFAVWQNGYAANYVYQSGRAPQGNVEAQLPDEGGVYYVVFSNKFSPKLAKKVNADIVLRYKSWMPQSVRRAGERFWNWFGL